MNHKYTFFDGGDIEFDDSRSVRELIEYAFDRFGFYEPMGMDVLTLFQSHYPNTHNGWFTTNVNLKCSDEILNRENLFFGYHIPNVFYLVEGGWGHHTKDLGNRPEIPNEVRINLRTKDFDGSVVINGAYTLYDVVCFLKENEYLDTDCETMTVIPVGVGRHYSVPLSDAIISLPLTEFVKQIEVYNVEKLKLDDSHHVYYSIISLI